MKRTACLLVALLAMPAQAAVYKCLVGGKPVYQDRPCADPKGGEQLILSAPSAGSASRSSEPSAAPTAVGQKPTPQEINDAWLKGVARDEAAQRKASRIRAAENDRDLLVYSMDRELRILRLKKATANNNLAGATYEQSLSAEMQAISTAYDAKIRSKEEEIKRLREEP